MTSLNLANERNFWRTCLIGPLCDGNSIAKRPSYWKSSEDVERTLPMSMASELPPMPEDASFDLESATSRVQQTVKSNHSQ